MTNKYTNKRRSHVYNNRMTARILYALTDKKQLSVNKLEHWTFTTTITATITATLVQTMITIN